MLHDEENKADIGTHGSKAWRVLKKVGFWMLFLGVPLVLTAPFWLWGMVYVYRLFSHDELTPSEFEAMLGRKPATLQELRLEMSKKYGEYQMDWSNPDEVKSVLETLESYTASYLEHGFEMHRAVWRGGENKASEVKYIYAVETKPVSAQVINDGGGCDYYYCLLDKDCRILGWVFPEE